MCISRRAGMQGIEPTCTRARGRALGRGGVGWEVVADVCVLELDGLLREALEVGGDDPLVTVAAPAPRSRSAARQPRRWQGLGGAGAWGWGGGVGRGRADLGKKWRQSVSYITTTQRLRSGSSDMPHGRGWRYGEGGRGTARVPPWWSLRREQAVQN